MSSIEERLDRIEHKLDALMAALRSSGAPRAANGSGNGDSIDADIDGPRGDPEVRFVPKRWSGADYKGQKFSSCDPAFLDMLADAYEWFAQRDDESGAVDKNGAPKSKWSRLDGSRARAWSARLRGNDGGASVSAKPRGATPANGRRAPAPPPDNGRGMGDLESSQDDDIPF